MNWIKHEALIININLVKCIIKKEEKKIYIHSMIYTFIINAVSLTSVELEEGI